MPIPLTKDDGRCRVCRWPDHRSLLVRIVEVIDAAGKRGLGSACQRGESPSAWALRHE